MNADHSGSRFYFNMGLLLLGLVILGFGSASFATGLSPLEHPILFHFHGISYILWFSLFILQASLIAKRNVNLHMTMGYSSLMIFALMLVSGALMTAIPYERGISPIPDMKIQQFLVFPLIDLFGLILFYCIAFLNRKQALTHKHAMLMTGIAIMDPALARLAIVIGVPPLALLFHLLLIGLVIFHDRKTHSKVHWVTWLGLAYIILRPVCLMTLGATEGWSQFIDGIYS